MKRTYKLSISAVEAVRELAEGKRVAPTQDGVVEIAILELRRRLREADDAEAWTAAAADPEFVAEASTLVREFASGERTAWPD